jgi:hypothetical protein
MGSVVDESSSDNGSFLTWALGRLGIRLE